MAAAPAARRRGSGRLQRAVRLASTDRLRGPGWAETVDPRPGTVRPQPSSDGCRRAGAVGARAAVPGAAPGAGHTRPAGLLARQLRRREGGDEGAVPETSVAR